jgi:nucleotide-binding universal stress UspA family protein
LPLHLLSVVGADAQRPAAQAFVSTMLTQSRESGVLAQGEVRSGKASTEILAARTQCQADLIVIGSRSNSHIGRAMVGGVAQKVMGLSEVPVLVLHASSSKEISS